MDHCYQQRHFTPYKIMDASRENRFGIVAASLQELVSKARDKLDLRDSNVRIVLEADGTQIDDDDYFSTLENNTSLMLLTVNQKWIPNWQNMSQNDCGGGQGISSSGRGFYDLSQGVSGKVKSSNKRSRIETLNTGLQAALSSSLLNDDDDNNVFIIIKADKETLKKSQLSSPKKKKPPKSKPERESNQQVASNNSTEAGPTEVEMLNNQTVDLNETIDGEQSGTYQSQPVVVHEPFTRIWRRKTNSFQYVHNLRAYNVTKIHKPSNGPPKTYLKCLNWCATKDNCPGRAFLIEGQNHIEVIRSHTCKPNPLHAEILKAKEDLFNTASENPGLNPKQLYQIVSNRHIPAVMQHLPYKETVPNIKKRKRESTLAISTLPSTTLATLEAVNSLACQY